MYPIKKSPDPIRAHEADEGKDQSDAKILPQRDRNVIEPVDEELREEGHEVSDGRPRAGFEQTLQSGLHASPKSQREAGPVDS